MTANARVLLISYAHKPAGRIVSYAHFLRGHGLDVDLIVWDAEKWRAFRPGLPAGVRLYSVRDQEERVLALRLESLVVHRIPAAVLALAVRVAQSTRMTRPLAPALTAGQRMQERLAQAFHHRIFGPAYAVVRPRILARVTTKALGRIDFGALDRIVAADPVAITYAARLARRYPDTPAFRGLDRHPYMQRDEPAPSTATTA